MKMEYGSRIFMLLGMGSEGCGCPTADRSVPSAGSLIVRLFFLLLLISNAGCALLTTALIDHVDRESSYEEIVTFENIRAAYINEKDAEFKLCFEGDTYRIWDKSHNIREITMTASFENLPLPTSSEKGSVATFDHAECGFNWYQKRMGFISLPRFDLQIIESDDQASPIHYRFQGLGIPVSEAEMIAPVLDTTQPQWKLIAARRDAVINDLFERVNVPAALIECVDDDCNGPINPDPASWYSRRVTFLTRGREGAAPLLATFYDVRNNVERPNIKWLNSLVIFTLPIDIIAAPFEFIYWLNYGKLNLSGIR